MKYAYMLAVLLLVGVGLPMIVPGPDGKPIMSPQDWLPDQQTLDNVRQQGKQVLQTVSSTAKKSTEQLETLAESSNLLAGKPNNQEATTEVFSWQDDEGNWHISDAVPEGLDTTVRIHRLKPVNTISALEIPETVETSQPQSSQPQSSLLQESAESDNRISQLMKDVQAIKEKSLERQKALDNL